MSFDIGKIERVCQVCSKKYNATGRIQKYCSDKCAKIAFKSNSRLRDTNSTRQGVSEQNRATTAPNLGAFQGTFANYLTIKKCKVCGEDFETKYRASLYCSEECKSKKFKLHFKLS